MEICYSTEDLAAYLKAHVKADQEHPLLLDRFLENAIEVDVDALADGEGVWVAGIMQHVEEAGVHSGDSACVIPPMSLGEEMLEEIRATTKRIALELGVIGLINIQYGVAGGQAARDRGQSTCFAYGARSSQRRSALPLAKLACRLMLGERLAEQELPEGPRRARQRQGGGAAICPLRRRRLGPGAGDEEHRRGDGNRRRLPRPPSVRRRRPPGSRFPREGSIFITVTDTDKPAATQIAARFHDLGFEVIATGGTAQAISAMGVPVTRINKLGEGSPHVVDLIHERRCDLVINTPTGSGARADGYEIRSAAVRHGIPCVTTMTGASAAVRAIAARPESPPRSARCRRSTRRRQRLRSLDDRPARASSLQGHRQPDIGRLPTSSRCSMRSGPEPEAGQFYMLASERHWEQGERARPSCPARSRLPDFRRRTATASGSTSCSRRSAPVRSDSVSWRRGRGSGSPARSATPSLRRGSFRRGAAGAVLVGGGIGDRSTGALRRALRRTRYPHRVLLGFRDRAHTGGLDDLILRAVEVRLATEDGHVGHPRLCHRPARGDP